MENNKTKPKQKAIEINSEVKPNTNENLAKIVICYTVEHSLPLLEKEIVCSLLN